MDKSGIFWSMALGMVAFMNSTVIVFLCHEIVYFVPDKTIGLGLLGNLVILLGFTMYIGIDIFIDITTKSDNDIKPGDNIEQE